MLSSTLTLDVKSNQSSSPTSLHIKEGIFYSFITEHDSTVSLLEQIRNYQKPGENLSAQAVGYNHLQ